MHIPSREIRLAADFTGMLEISGCELLTGEQTVGQPPFIDVNPIKTPDGLERLNIALQLDPASSEVVCTRGVVTPGEGRYGKLRTVAGICRVVDVEIQPVFERRRASETPLSQEVLTSSIESAANDLIEAVNDQNSDDQSNLKWLEEYFDYGRSYGNAYLAFHAMSSERKRELWGRMHFVSGDKPPHYLEKLKELIKVRRPHVDILEYVKTLAV